MRRPENKASLWVSQIPYLTNLAFKCTYQVCHVAITQAFNTKLIVGRPGNEAVQLASQNVHLDMTLHALVLVSTTTVYR